MFGNRYAACKLMNTQGKQSGDLIIRIAIGIQYYWVKDYSMTKFESLH